MLPILGFALIRGVVIWQENDDLVNVAKSRNRATLAAADDELRGTVSTLQAIADVRELKNDDARVPEYRMACCARTDPGRTCSHLFALRCASVWL